MSGYDGPKPWLRREPTPCAGEGCDWLTVGEMVFRSLAPEIRRAKHYRRHISRGLCSACHHRLMRTGTTERRPNPNSRPKAPLPPWDCAGGCGKLVARNADKAAGVVAHGSRGLCEPCERRAKAEDWYDDLLPRIRTREEVLEEWEFLRGEGVVSVRQAAERMGMTHKALDKALYLARKAGDPRAALPHRNLRSAS